MTRGLLGGGSFVVAVPDIYHETTEGGSYLDYDGPGADRGNELKVAKAMDAYDSDAVAAIAFLQRHPSSTGKVRARRHSRHERRRERRKEARERVTLRASGAGRQQRQYPAHSPLTTHTANRRWAQRGFASAATWRFAPRCNRRC